MLTQEQRRIVRLLARESYPYPVVVVEGKSFAPRVTGRGSCYTNGRGEVIRHPSAYAKVGRSSMMYRHSNRRVEVGARWVERVFGVKAPHPMPPDMMGEE